MYTYNYIYTDAYLGYLTNQIYLTNLTYIQKIYIYYTIWLFNIAMERSTILQLGKPSISMGHLYHGYVSHNQRLHISYKSGISPSELRRCSGVAWWLIRVHLGFLAPRGVHLEEDPVPGTEKPAVERGKGRSVDQGTSGYSRALYHFYQLYIMFQYKYIYIYMQKQIRSKFGTSIYSMFYHVIQL